MARSSLAPESVIANELRALELSGRNFCKIVDYPYGTFSWVMADETQSFKPADIERFQEKLRQMKELVEAIGLIPDWSRSGEIANTLMVRLVMQVAAEMKNLDRTAQNAERDL